MKIPCRYPITDSKFNIQIDSRLPGRQISPQTISEQTVTTPAEETFASTRQPGRGRVHFNAVPTEDDSSFIVTAQPVSTQYPRDTQTKSKSTTGNSTAFY